MKKLIFTLSVATVAVLFAANAANAASNHHYLASHPGIASKAALRNSPHVRRILREQAVALTPGVASLPGDLIEYGSAFTAPVLPTAKTSAVVVSHSARDTRPGAVVKPGNTHWRR